MNKTVYLVLTALLLVGCTNTEKGAVIGGASGAGIGAIIGNQSGRSGEGAAIGAAAGTILGGLIGHQVDKEEERRTTSRAYRQGVRHAETAPPPGKSTWVEGHWEYITKKRWVDTSETERVWVEEHIEGDRRVEGHWEERTVPSGYWEEYQKKVWVEGHWK